MRTLRFFRARWSACALAAGALVTAALVAELLGPGSALAQDPGVEPPPEAVESGETSDAAEMPDALRAPALDPFSAGVTLQARRLRGLTAEAAGLLMGGSPDGGQIAFEPLATPLPGSSGTAYVPLFIEIDGPTFLESNQ